MSSKLSSYHNGYGKLSLYYTDHGIDKGYLFATEGDWNNTPIDKFDDVLMALKLVPLYYWNIVAQHEITDEKLITILNEPEKLSMITLVFRDEKFCFITETSWLRHPLNYFDNICMAMNLLTDTTLDFISREDIADTDRYEHVQTLYYAEG